MKVLICGGHLTPALAVIQTLPKDTHIVYVGRKYALEGDNAFSLEYKTITQLNIPFEEINTGRLQRHITKHTISSLLKLPKGVFQAFSIVKKYKPDVIVGFGGYVSVPIVFSGFLKKIPTIIHEQTLTTGLANKILAPFVTKICISWESSKKYFPKEKTVLTGNPAVSEIAGKSKGERAKGKQKDEKKLLIVGGSLGSHTINTAIEEILEKLLQQYTIVHQTGDAKEFEDFNRIEKTKNRLSQSLQKKYTIVKFIDPKEIMNAFSKADLVITRAGINTLTSLLVLNKPALVIPIANKEQTTNAVFFKQCGLGEILYQKDLNGNEILNSLKKMKNNFALYKSNHTNGFSIHKNASNKIVAIIFYANIAQKTKKS